MRVVDFAITAALIAGVSAPALAQSSATPPPATPPAATSTPTYAGTTQSHWIATGFVGSNFGSSTTEWSVDFGGQAAYLWHGVVGVEAVTDFAPTFKINNVFLADHPHVYSYMANAIGAIPLGAEGQYQPYVSGGFGAIQLVSQVLTFSLATPLNEVVNTAATGTTQANDARLGSNIGGGFMVFGGNVGFRTDVRYYRASTNAAITATDPPDILNRTLLSGLDFWRANVGLAIRW